MSKFNKSLIFYFVSFSEFKNEIKAAINHKLYLIEKASNSEPQALNYMIS